MKLIFSVMNSICMNLTCASIISYFFLSILSLYVFYSLVNYLAFIHDSIDCNKITSLVIGFCVQFDSTNSNYILKIDVIETYYEQSNIRWLFLCMGFS